MPNKIGPGRLISARIAERCKPTFMADVNFFYGKTGQPEMILNVVV
jgi:hypothetical protein